MPSKKMLPEVAGCSWVMSRPRVDFPQPDSPTRPRVSPVWISKLTPSTALTEAPRPAGKYLTAFSTRTNGTRSATDCRLLVLEGPVHRDPARRSLIRTHVQKRGVFAQTAIDPELAAWIELAASRRAA